jgi:hypothetical protein
VKSGLKAVVFKTPRLKESMAFFTDLPGFGITEFSPTHFVIYSKGIRIVFIGSDSELEVELYLDKKNGESFTILEDPNQIKVIIS